MDPETGMASAAAQAGAASALPLEPVPAQGDGAAAPLASEASDPTSGEQPSKRAKAGDDE